MIVQQHSDSIYPNRDELNHYHESQTGKLTKFFSEIEALIPVGRVSLRCHLLYTLIFSINNLQNYYSTVLVFSPGAKHGHVY
jgi:hypothetical protein